MYQHPEELDLLHGGNAMTPSYVQPGTTWDLDLKQADCIQTLQIVPCHWKMGIMIAPVP